MDFNNLKNGKKKKLTIDNQRSSFSILMFPYGFQFFNIMDMKKHILIF